MAFIPQFSPLRFAQQFQSSSSKSLLPPAVSGFKRKISPQTMASNDSVHFSGEIKPSTPCTMSGDIDLSKISAEERGRLSLEPLIIVSEGAVITGGILKTRGAVTVNKSATVESLEAESALDIYGTVKGSASNRKGLAIVNEGASVGRLESDYGVTLRGHVKGDVIVNGR